MTKVVPVLQIDNFKEATQFYVDGLGFEVIFSWQHEPDFPIFAGIRKGDIDLNISEHGKGHPGTEIYIYVDDINVWHELCEANGIAPEHPPQRQPWGATEMLVLDPFRNALRFSQPDESNT